MQNIIVHVGFHKTGSTAIQAAFDKYKGNGVRYANLGYQNHSIPFYTAYSNHHQNYHKWTSAGLTPDEIERKKAQITRRIERYFMLERTRDIIVSGEDISVIPDQGISDLHRMLSRKSRKITIVAYVREPVAFMMSEFQERLKSGIDASRPAIPNYRGKLEKFFREFGRENVIIRDFSAVALVNGNVVDDFASIIGVPAPLINGEANTSLSTEAVRAVYNINQIVGGREDAAKFADARWKCIDHLRSLLPGRCTIPGHLLAGLVNREDVQWLHEVSGVDFRSSIPEADVEFDPQALSQFLAQPDPSTIEVIRAYLRDHENVAFPPEDTKFLLARYLISFMGR